MAERWNPFSTVPGSSVVGDTSAEGTDPRTARADHKHGREIYGTPVAVTPDASAGAGSGTDVVRANHQHGMATYSSTPAAVAATGGAGTSATAPSRGDHAHAMGILTTQGDMLVRGSVSIGRLGIGAANFVLKSDGTDVGWGSVPAPVFVSMAKFYVD